MSEIYFLTRHTPFWAIPLLVLSAEFGYMFWLKKKKRTAVMCLMLAAIATACCAFYFWQGGPEKSVNYIKKMHRNYK
jgi:uncharacterized membrane protein YdjX (TVP38/TMEM64 family)